MSVVGLWAVMVRNGAAWIYKFAFNGHAVALNSSWTLVYGTGGPHFYIDRQTETSRAHGEILVQ